MLNYVIILINIFNLFNLINCVKFELGPCLLQYLEPCTENVIEFYLFTSDRPKAAPILLDTNNPEIPMWINLEYSNKLIIHGYGGNLDFHATKAIRNAYLHRNSTNVIIVDWGKLANLPCYPTASFNTRQAGQCSARFLNNLYAMHKHRNLDLRKFHIIGFSLGAHVAGFTSNEIYKTHRFRISRITGLDPALPFFTTINRRSKLDKSDAKFVDVIHTNSGIYGKIEPSGHIDFYLNGGQSQPGCQQHKNQPLCSHLLATIYFAESINSAIGFWGIRCTNYFQYLIGLCNVRTQFSEKRILMGEFCSHVSTGIIFIDTNSRPPYALG